MPDGPGEVRAIIASGGLPGPMPFDLEIAGAPGRPIMDAFPRFTGSREPIVYGAGRSKPKPQPAPLTLRERLRGLWPHRWVWSVTEEHAYESSRHIGFYSSVERAREACELKDPDCADDWEEEDGSLVAFSYVVTRVRRVCRRKVVR
jgi:hypothetical protein